MALQIMKIAVQANSTVELNPNIQRFFYVTNSTTGAGDTLTIGATDFFDDSGNGVTVLPELAANNSAYNLYINGVLQMEGVAEYTPGGAGVGSLAIEVPTIGAPIHNSTPIVVEIMNYAPSTNITIET